MSICAKIVFSQNCWDVKYEVFENIIAFFVVVFLMLETEKQNQKKKTKWKRPKKPIKIVFFKGGHPKKRRTKKKINCLTLFVSGRAKNAHFHAHYLFWPK